MCGLACLTAARPADAIERYGYYECRIEHAYRQKEGGLAPDAFSKKYGVNFQQRSANAGVLSWGIKTPWISSDVKILQHLSNKEDLVVIPTNSAFLFKIKASSDLTNLKFVLIDGLPASYSSGHCSYIAAP